MAEPPSPKKPKMDMQDSYIPTEDGDSTSVIFSLKEEKGALVRALKPFEVGHVQ